VEFRLKLQNAHLSRTVSVGAHRIRLCEEISNVYRALFPFLMLNAVNKQVDSFAHMQRQKIEDATL